LNAGSIPASASKYRRFAGKKKTVKKTFAVPFPTAL
jgi:hypothetical protein